MAEDMTEREFENVLRGKGAKHKRKISAAQEKMKRLSAKQKQVRG